MAATLDNLEDWLIAIATHTRETKEAVQGRAGALSPGTGGGGLAGKADSTMFDKLKKAVEDGLRTGLYSGLSQARGLASRGFSGTTEQAANSYAMEMMAKQFASVMKPLMDAMTAGAAIVEKNMRALNGGQQNKLMGGIIGAGIGARLGGPVGLAAGAYIGATAAGVLDDYKTETSKGVKPGGAAIAATLPRIAAAAAWINPLTAPIALYREIAGKKGAGELTREAMERNGMLTKKTKEDEAPRRDVTPFQAALMEAGGTTQIAQEALIRGTAGTGTEEGGMFAPILKALDEILRQLIIMSGGTPPPRSATAAA